MNNSSFQTSYFFIHCHSKMDDIELYKERLSVVESLFAMRQQQFDLLLEITRIQNHNLPLQALVSIYEHILSAQLGILRSALIVQKGDNKWSCISYKGMNAAFLKTNFSVFVQEFEKTVGISALPSYYQSEFEFVIPIMFKSQPIGYVLLGDIPDDKFDTEEEKLKFTQTIASIVCSVHENTRLTNMETQQKIVQRDIQLASEMQRMLVPSKFPENKYFKVSGFYKPFRGIGGDYYDFIPISQNNYFFCICDVSGKGIPAAMLMANFQANVRLMVYQGLSLEELCQILNNSVYSLAQGESFVTAFIGTINTETGDCEYVNAGLNPTYTMVNGTLAMLSDGCTVLGALPKLPKIKTGKTNLLPSALLINYTDGITEATNAEDEQFGEERLEQFIKQNYQLPTELFNLKLIQTLLAFCGNDTFDDDLSLLTISYTSGN